MANAKKTLKRFGYGKDKIKHYPVNKWTKEQIIKKRNW